MNRFYLRATAAAALLFTCLFGAILWVEPAPRLLWNASESAPPGLYRVDINAVPEVGDLVAIMPRGELAAYMARRHYLPEGIPLLKRVAANRGARVCRSGATVSVDGVPVARALLRDQAGRSLPVWGGCRILAKGELFLINAVQGSLDSRYFGPLPDSGLLGTAHPIATRDASNATLRWRTPDRSAAFPCKKKETCSWS